MKRFFNWFNFTKTKKVQSKIYTTETDISTMETPILFNINLIVGKSNKGPINQPIDLTPKVKPIKWYEFWKDKQKYTDEVNRCKNEFKTIFGTPDAQ